MKEVKIGGIEFDEDLGNSDPYIIGSFGPEGTGKTRLPITGPELIGFIPLENKSYFTITKDATEMGKRVLKPKDPQALIVDPRKIYDYDDDKLKKFYQDQVKRVTDTIYGMLAHPDVKVVVVDKFGQLSHWIEFAVNGMKGKFKKIKEQVIQDKSESNQEIIDLINSFSKFKKPVILTHACKDEFLNDKRSGRQTWDGFKFLGSHCNVILEHKTNIKWDPASDDEDKNWQFSVSVRKCQRNPSLEGPQGQNLLKDSDILLARLIQEIDPGADIEEWM